ncbi:BRCT domain-containing protein [Bifidobacterium tissieri]|uniref:BRCT domain-containing protein n=2 Tax=Bifidobacterium tissieri TaxID=1630162 RepID=A0A5M9ZMI4_9BIFI|nr:BRCT domain-containing protein [Bifidobacterium tissieri]KAA8833088.1 BRCT domain-containing protein [Bifidobacterium tissieri]
MRMIPDWPGWNAHLDAAERAVWPRIGEDMVRWMPRPTHTDAGSTFTDNPFADNPFADNPFADEPIPITEHQIAGRVENAGIHSSVNPAGTAHAQTTPTPPPRLREGDRIVLTGSMSQRRSDWIDDLSAVGIVVWPSVTKKVRLVVAADVDSESTKARKARDYGIPIVSERWLKTAIENGIDA